MLDADITILGGGCAGLSLAAELAEHAPHLRVFILESRARYSRDRTWCFWEKEQHPFSGAVTHQWRSWRVRHKGIEARQQSLVYSYQHLPADRFYELATQKIVRAGHKLILNAEARSVQQFAGRCRVETNQGTLHSTWVFDSRPRRLNLAPVLEQRFTGWHVRHEYPCFDPNVVDLMDFAVETHPGRTAFFYILPFSATEALVEATFFDQPSLAPADADSMLRRYMEERTRGSYQVLYRECATLSMGEPRASSPISPKDRLVDIGARGGRVKPSSGYAFQRIQRQSQAFARSLARRKPLPHTIEPSTYGVLDGIFLRALQRHPDRAPDYFLALFEMLSPEMLVRFMSETASKHDILRVMLALPKLDFLRAAIMPRHMGCSRCRTEM